MRPTNKNPHLIPFLTQATPWLVFVLISFYTGILLLENPAMGFDFSRNSVVQVLTPNIDLSVGDQILEIDGQPWEPRWNNIYIPIYQGYQAGDPITFTIQKENGVAKQITLTYKNNYSAEFRFQLSSGQWIFTYFFWLAGAAVFLIVRPRDTRWRLLVSYLFLWAVWLAVGGGPSHLHLYGSAVALRVLSWWFMPIMIHLHWEFPHPFETPPKWLKQGSLYLTYPLALFMSIFQFTLDEYIDSYALGMLIGLMSSVFLLFAHFFIQKQSRRDTGVLLIFSITALLPLMLVALVTSLGVFIPHQIEVAAIFSLPLIPLAYAYTIARRQLGEFELRANRLIGAYLFIVLLFILLILISIPFSIPGEENNSYFTYTLMGGIFAALFTMIAYQPFLRFVEKRLLGMSIPPESLLQKFSDNINILSDPKDLANVLQTEILGSMLVQQSALLEDTSILTGSPWLYTQNVSPPPPSHEDYVILAKNTKKYLSEDDLQSLPSDFEWVRLILPLSFEERLLGLWLLGLKDPDDYYSIREIDLLQTLANQIAITLLNHQQAQNLRALYQANIDRHEVERASLGRDLHDETLNRLALLKQQANHPQLQAEIENTIIGLRGIIYGLRPEMLNYGLITALQDLGDSLNQRSNGVKVIVNIDGEITKTEDEHIELHLFRIVQQACENALTHAGCQTITISGQITPNLVDLCVADDGSGFKIERRPKLTKLLEEKHFGIAGMFERASLIQAHLEILPARGQGTAIQINWAG